jgi:hypothetical protein
MQVLTKERRMISTKKNVPAFAIITGLFAIGIMMKTAVVSGQSPTPAPQPANAVAPINPESGKVVVGEIEAKKLLLLMDADKNGKISRAEFMAFMATEFDRLDINKDGELDVKELEKSQLSVVRHGGGHR